MGLKLILPPIHHSCSCLKEENTILIRDLILPVARALFKLIWPSYLCILEIHSRRMYFWIRRCSEYFLSTLKNRSYQKSFLKYFDDYISRDIFPINLLNCIKLWTLIPLCIAECVPPWVTVQCIQNGSNSSSALVCKVFIDEFVTCYLHMYNINYLKCIFFVYDMILYL